MEILPNDINMYIDIVINFVNNTMLEIKLMKQSSKWKFYARKYYTFNIFQPDIFVI